MSRKMLMIQRKNIQLSPNFIWRKPGRFDFVGNSCQKLGITKDVLVHFKKYADAFVFKNGYLLDRNGWLQSET